MITQTVWNAMDPGRTGYWGAATSSIDWCELNYEHSNYIAELFNSLSNIAFIALASVGIFYDLQQKLPRRFSLAHLGLVAIGAGSLLFHSTLQYRYQLMDELPMIWISLLFTYVVFDLTPIGYFSKKQPLLAISLVLFNLAFTIAYLRFPNPVFHQLAYGLLVLVTLCQGVRILYCTELISSYAIEQNAKARKLQIIGASLFIFAFLCWNIDNLLCSELSHLREKTGIPLLFEGHAAWHIFVCLGVFYVIVSMQSATLSVRDNFENYEILYSFKILPYVSRTLRGWKAINSIHGTETSSLINFSR